MTTTTIIRPPADERMADGLIDIDPTSYFSKRAETLGRLTAMLLLFVCAPIIAILIVLVRISSRGPGLYKQVRVGKNGKIFVMYKIRSMIEDAEVGTGPVWTQDRNDPRITLTGRFLRKSHLDELPQLLNVARGEMALFGPRPERPELVHLLAERIPGYLNRLSVRPGITGLAQINLPPDSDLESVRRKLVLDIEYIVGANSVLDFRMFVWTGLRLIGVSSSIATKLLGLGRNVKPVENTNMAPVSVAELLARHTDDDFDDDEMMSSSSHGLGESVSLTMRTSPKL